MLEREITTQESQAANSRDPQTDPAYIPDTYQVDIDVRTGEVQIRSFRDGVRMESYRPYKRGEASIAVNAILNGFQPPRDLRHLETPTARTRSARASAPAS